MPEEKGDPILIYSKPTSLFLVCFCGMTSELNFKGIGIGGAGIEFRCAGCNSEYSLYAKPPHKD